jgi:hypothetical protein
MRPHHKFQICPWCWPPHYYLNGVAVFRRLGPFDRCGQSSPAVGQAPV